MNLVAIVTRRGKKQIQKLVFAEDQTLTIGRSWNCDIVVDDKYVDAIHANLHVNNNESLSIEDNNSTNGTSVNKKALKGAQSLVNGSRISIGETLIELINGDQEVVPAVKCSTSQKWLRRLTSPLGIVVTTGLAVMAMLFSIYVLGSEEATADTIFQQFAGLAAVFIVWCLVVGILGKVFRGETGFLSHWVLLCLTFCGAILVSTGAEVLQFNLNSDTANLLLNGVLGTLFLGVFCYVTLSLITNLGVTRKLPLTGLLAILPFAWQLAQPHLAEERDSWTSWVNEYQTSQPPGWVFAKPTTLDEHLQGYDEIFASLARQVEQGEDLTPATGNKLQLSDIN